LHAKIEHGPDDEQPSLKKAASHPMNKRDEKRETERGHKK